jgi:hypothetical protein
MAGEATQTGNDERAAAVRLNLLISGVYAWLATVAAPAWGSRALGSSGGALGALLLLGIGLALLPRWPSWGRALGMPGFLSACTLTWISLGNHLDPLRLHPLQAASGALGWVLFAFSWGSVRNVHNVPENDPRVIPGKPLRPRATLSRQAYVAFGVALLGGLLPWLMAWRVGREQHALLAHAAGLLCAIAMVTAGAHVALRVGRPSVVRPARARLALASNAFAGLVVLFVLGALGWFLRR